MSHVGNAGHLDFEGDGDLLLDLFGGASGPLRDDLNVVVGNVRVSFDREILERDDSPGEEKDCETEDHPAVIQSKIYETTNHFRSAVFCSASGKLQRRGNTLAFCLKVIEPMLWLVFLGVGRCFRFGWLCGLE